MESFKDQSNDITDLFVCETRPQWQPTELIIARQRLNHFSRYPSILFAAGGHVQGNVMSKNSYPSFLAELHQPLDISILENSDIEDVAVVGATNRDMWQRNLASFL